MLLCMSRNSSSENVDRLDEGEGALWQSSLNVIWRTREERLHWRSMSSVSGNPKGVVLTHGSVIANITGVVQQSGFSEVNCPARWPIHWSSDLPSLLVYPVDYWFFFNPSYRSTGW